MVLVYGIILSSISGRDIPIQFFCDISKDYIIIVSKSKNQKVSKLAVKSPKDFNL
jgi:hypothetical protein